MKPNALVVLCLLVRVTHSFIAAPYVSLQATGRSSSPTTAVSMKINAPHEGVDFLRRKAGDVVALALATSLVVSLGSTPAKTLAEEVPAGTNPFNSICLGFGCGEYQGLEYGGAPAPTDEDSIPFKTFLESLDKGLVAKVDFESGGNKAYVFLKPESGEGEAKRIRVGEGYPEEQSKGWSSPLWVVRALRDRQVPYTLGYDLGKGKTTDTVTK